MASFVFNVAKEKILTAACNLGNGSALDIRAIICCNNTTNAGTSQDATTISGITLDEYDGSGYSRADLNTSATNFGVSKDDANDRAEWHLGDASPVSFGSTVAADSGGSIDGVLFYVHVTNDTDSWPLCYDDSVTGNGGGGALTYTENAEGVFYI